ncbi:hypothetical protein Lalb_Chr06g0162171 [Lupinus albus]|uniref:Uncharacterized protein n=1 Tax=Lupinus albus TaxID=3870 RepID=A0A6A4QCU4_LUPAL|nr:hypothetical protein Lalb_Chr06g0162171 [Lupinus albus]
MRIGQRIFLSVKFIFLHPIINTLKNASCKKITYLHHHFSETSSSQI